MTKTSHPAIVLDPLELPLPTAPDMPLWAENYVYSGTCPNAGVSFFLHLGRQSFNTNLWRETFIVGLPGDMTLLWKGYGCGAHETGPGGAQLKFSCNESFKRWTIAFTGAARLVPNSEVNYGAPSSLCDGPVVPVDMRLEMAADTPIWDLGATVSGHAWGKDHYQQSMRVVGGEINIDGEVTSLNQGVATRDHTRGPRDFSGLGSYAWIHGGFPGGRRFITMALDPREGYDQPPIRNAIIADSKGIYPAEITQTSIPQHPNGEPMNYTLELKGPNGIETIEAERLQTVVISVGAPNHFIIGPSTDNLVKNHVFESPTRFRWNGEICYGYSERGLAL